MHLLHYLISTELLWSDHGTLPPTLNFQSKILKLVVDFSSVISWVAKIIVKNSLCILACFWCVKSVHT